MMLFTEAAGLFRDSWGLYRKYCGQDKSRAMWDRLIGEAEGLYGKYGKKPFARDIIVAVISEVERIGRQGRQQAE